MAEDVLKRTDEAASPSYESKEAVNVSSEAELTSLHLTQGKRDYENEIISLKLKHAKELTRLKEDYERKIETLTSEHLSKTNQLENELKEERGKGRLLSNKNTEDLVKFDKLMQDKGKNHSERIATNVEDIGKLRSGITARRTSSDERLENIENILGAKLADAFGGDCRQINELTSDKERLQKDLEIARCEIRTLQSKLDAAKNKIEKKKIEMKGKNDDYVILLCDRHEEVVSNLRIEIEKLKSSYQDDCLALKTACENEKQQLKDEYDNFKRDFKESQQGQLDDILRQKDAEIGKVKEEMQRHQQELSDKETQLEGLRLSDGEKIAELEACEDRLRRELDDKIQGNTAYINKLLAKHVKSENELRNEKKGLENKIYDLERKLDKVRSLKGFSAMDD